MTRKAFDLVFFGGGNRDARVWRPKNATTVHMLVHVNNVTEIRRRSSSSEGDGILIRAGYPLTNQRDKEKKIIIDISPGEKTSDVPTYKKSDVPMGTSDIMHYGFSIAFVRCTLKGTK